MKTKTTDPDMSADLAPLEWPTWSLIVTVYGGWFLLMQYYHVIGVAVALPLLILICALHGSMCHELIHGHPTRISAINTMLASVPLMLFLPYPIYRESHLNHHNDENITLPGKDPESYYCSASEYRRKTRLGKAFAWVNMTIVGRLLLSPAVEIFRLSRLLLDAIGSVDVNALKIWAVHLISVELLLLLIVEYFQVPWWHYLLIAYFASSLTRIRSFYEHRARTTVSERTVLMEPCLFFRVLFLNLNFHLAHHEHPSIPWYRLARYYHAHRSELISRSGDFYYRGYRYWLLGNLFRPVDSPIHPFDQSSA
ncbi:MAG: fatty acid desaturase [Gammaproteobacteria bacterium]|nr:fatty acid desaturase [Gammaproteobacteria bacterium]